MRLLRALLLALTLLVIAPAVQAQEFPKLTGRVVDAANLLDPAQEQALTDKLAALETQSGRQLVVATIPDLQGYDIADFGYRLGRAWGIGSKAKNDGSLLIVAPNERRVRIEAGYGVEGILTDAMSSRIIRNDITPQFKNGNMPAGIDAGVTAIAALLTLPPDEARAQAAAVEQAQRSQSSNDSGAVIAIWIGLFVLFFILLPLLSRTKGGKRYRRSGHGGPVIIWGPDLGGSSWGSGGGSSWGGGGGSDWGGGGGGFSGGGGSFGGGGASGDW
jgi:uncharacterized protein